MGEEDLEAKRLITEKLFKDGFEAARTIGEESSEWDSSYLLKEAAVTLRAMIEATESDDVEKLYNHGLRAQALLTLYVTRLLEADSRGEFDE